MTSLRLKECDNAGTGVNSDVDTASQTTATRSHQSRLERVYRGNFSSSISDLFSDPYDRSSCCAFACCGILLSDRNRHAHDGTMPTNWWLRCACVVALAISCIVFFPLFVILLALIAVSQTMMRAQFRRQLKESIANSAGTTEDRHALPVHYCCSEERRAHRMIACIPNDIIYIYRNNTSEEEEEQQQQLPGSSSFADTTSTSLDRKPTDLCDWIWKLVAATCCGVAGCWIHCCGICAVGQEHRELRKRLPPERFYFDYITFQPYAEYLPKLEYLRRTNTTSFTEHFKSLSILSQLLVRFLLGSLLLLSVAALMSKQFHMATVVVVILTLLQAGCVLYLVYWRNHRLDISLDAVIKLFASGFVLATSFAVVVEQIVMFFVNVVFVVVIIREFVEDNPNMKLDDVPDNAKFMLVLMDIYQKHFLTLVLLVFCYSFITAGLVEELVKYFCFWMVEHPDFLMTGNAATAITNPVSLPEQQPPPPTPFGSVARKSIHSRAAAITVGMVATATGFACCENLLYSLGSGNSFRSEITVLLLRSITPVHPIAAAIQSIGIVRRDVEGGCCGSRNHGWSRQQVGLGQAILPAVIFHGIFDFILMMLAVVLVVKEFQKIEQVIFDNPMADFDEEDLTDLTKSLQHITTHVMHWANALAVMVVLGGLGYYFVEARNQRNRLHALELTMGDDTDEVNDQVPVSAASAAIESFPTDRHTPAADQGILS